MGPYGWSADLTALIVVGILVLIMRWVFQRPKHLRSRSFDATGSPELGLLTVVATGVSRQDAMSLRAVLGEAGIRSSMSRRRDGAMDVLVFHGDVDRARILLGP